MIDFETLTLEEYINSSAAAIDAGAAERDEMPDNIAAGFLSNIYSNFNFNEDGTTPLFERAKKDKQIAAFYKTALKKAIDRLDPSLYGGK